MTDQDTQLYRRRKRVARHTELGASVAAGTVGAGFGAAKLRDEFERSYPGKLQRGINRNAGKARRAGVSAKTVGRAARTAAVGRPGFVPLVALTAAGATAAGAAHYQGHLQTAERRRLRAKVAKADTGAEPGKLPRYVIHAGVKKRVLGMHDKDHFKVLDQDDTTRIVHRSQVRHVRPVAKRGPTVSAFGVDHGYPIGQAP